MSLFNVDIKGLPELNMRLIALGSPGPANKATAAMAKRAKELAQADTPVFAGKVSPGHPAPGSMQKSARYASVKGRSGGRAYRVFYVSGKERQSVGRSGKNMDTYYSRFVMRGSKHNPSPKPIMDDVIKRHKDELLEVFENRLREEINKLW